MLQWINKNKGRILLNTIGWGILFDATYMNSLNYIPVSRSVFTLHVICYNLLYPLFSSLNTMWLMPKYFITKKYRTYIPAFIMLLLVCSVIMSRYNHWMLSVFPGVDSSYLSSLSIPIKGEDISWLFYYIAVMPPLLMVFFVFAIGFLTQQYFQVRKQQDAISKKQMESELSLLKSQINPHFLFNVLNSIYALSLKKSDHAPEIILKLSDMLRYMLYESRYEQIALDKEIGMIENYIAIEKIRIGTQQQITLKTENITESYFIAPVLLIPFVENAVKHGIDSISGEAYVTIDIRLHKGVLLFQCSNNYKAVQQKSSGGIGLENVKKRLELLYPGKYKLLISDEKTIFTVSLTLNLNT